MVRRPHSLLLLALALAPLLLLPAPARGALAAPVAWPPSQAPPSAAGQADPGMPDFLRRLVAGGYEARPYSPPPLSSETAGAAAAAAAKRQPGGGASGGGAALEAGPAAAPARSGARSSSLSTTDAPSGGSGGSGGGGSRVEVPACSRAFSTPGVRARSLAIILLRWRREYYPPREACCPGNPDPGCDCTWGGHKYDELPPPEAYSHIFSDECDGFTSINRALYRMSGGQVTFATNATARVLSAAANASAAAAAAAALPDGGAVDVYGWATLASMRGGDNVCLDWCAEAMRALGVSPTSHRHYVCFPLYKPDQPAGAPAVCDNQCPGGGECGGSCPPGEPYGSLPGCGCGTCYWAWGAQWKCGAVSGTRRHTTGFAAPAEAWSRGSTVRVVEGHKVYMTHELGHNLGLTHAASYSCTTHGDAVAREPGSCRPDWYGDLSTFMGAASSLTLPAYYRLQQGWLPRRVMRTIRESGRQVTLVLRDGNRPAPEHPGAPWWGDSDTVVARIPVNASLPGAFICPCAEGACAADAGSCAAEAQCAAGPCCSDEACADGGMGYYYVEFSKGPVPGDYGAAASAAFAGVSVRLAGELRDCASTRLVATHAAANAPRYALDAPDPAGKLPGSRFEDAARRVIVRLDATGQDWAQVSILRY